VPRLFSDTLRNNILLGYPGVEGEIFEAIAWRCWSATLMSSKTAWKQVGPRVKLSGGNPAHPLLAPDVRMRNGAVSVR
jgi:hypothetical protein